MVTLTKDLIKKLMPKFKRHEDLIVIQESAWEEFKKSLPIPVVKEENSPFTIDDDELASLVCQTVQKPPCNRLAVEKGIKNDDYRTPDVELILGDHGIVNHKENHIIYQFDATKCMFSFGNINEKMRMGELNCTDEIVVDLFAGIGYFSLPLLVHAKARHLYACEWNPDAIDALKKNLVLNKIDPSRYTVIEGDNRSNRPTDVAQRVILGILPSCIDWMQTAFECVDKRTGAMLHCHDLIETKPNSASSESNNADTSPISSNHEDSNLEPVHTNDIEFNAFEAKAQTLIDRIKDEVDAHDLRASLVQIQPVKSYAPHITHVVFDIKIEPKIKNLIRIPPL